MKRNRKQEGRPRRNRTAIIAISIFVALCLMATGFLIWKDQMEQRAYQVSQTEEGEGDDGVYMITYDGREYEYNNQITSLLLIGVDSKEPLKGDGEYGHYGRADNIELVILDKMTGKIKVLPISRDTMTEVSRYSINGYYAGTEKTHIGFAYSFGDGGRESCENVKDAVSQLLYGIPIDYYIATNLTSLGIVNDLLGGVTVEVPNDDLKLVRKEFVKGAKVKLTKDNVEDFLRYRDTKVKYSNKGRMERQKAFLEAAIEDATDMDEDDLMDMWDEINSRDRNIRTNLAAASFMKVMDKACEYDLDKEDSFVKIKGENKVKDGYDVFYPDKKALRKLVVDTFYIDSESVFE